MPRKIETRPGDRFGRLVVIGESERVRRSERRLLCRCDCGQECVTALRHLRHGGSRSCGCLKREVTAARSTTHGATLSTVRSPEFFSWSGMKARSDNPRASNYQNYGGRGIKICDEWRNDFSAFLAHVGRKPSPRHSIDRIDNSRGYEPGNVRWATRSEQNNNRRSRSEIRAAHEMESAKRGPTNG